MAQNPTVLSIDKLRRVSGSADRQCKTVIWHSMPLVIKQFLTFEEYIATVQKVIGDCMTPDNTCAVELLDFALRANIIASFAYVELPEDAKDLFVLAYTNDLYDTICSVANRSQIESIERTVSRMIG